MNQSEGEKVRERMVHVMNKYAKRLVFTCKTVVKNSTFFAVCFEYKKNRVGVNLPFTSPTNFLGLAVA